MVRGLDIFKKYFEKYPGNYVIIGGTACDIIIDEAGFVPRATKDIDIILVVEALSSEFVKQFWQFIKDGNYAAQEKSNDERQYYRFRKPEKTDFPYQIELFSRTPDVIVLEGAAHLTPIPVDDDLSSLSAILLNDDYYNYMIENSQVEDGLHHANIEAWRREQSVLRTAKRRPDLLKKADLTNKEWSQVRQWKKEWKAEETEASEK